MAFPSRNKANHSPDRQLQAPTLIYRNGPEGRDGTKAERQNLPRSHRDTEEKSKFLFKKHEKFWLKLPEAAWWRNPWSQF